VASFSPKDLLTTTVIPTRRAYKRYNFGSNHYLLRALNISVKNKSLFLGAPLFGEGLIAGETWLAVMLAGVSRWPRVPRAVIPGSGFFGGFPPY
jgi:hypothetical protein